MVATAHIHWNPQLQDVKHSQVCHLVNAATALADDLKCPLIVCGDFNTMPSDKIYAFLVDKPHSSPSGRLFDIKSAYAVVEGKEPSFTNYTPKFKATLDYIWFDSQRAAAKTVGALPARAELEAEIALPNSKYGSDHVPLVAELELFL